MLVEVASARPLEGVRILLVEDDDDIRDLMRIALEAQGAAVGAVANAGDAVLALEAEAPDVVLSDINMPGQDGHAFLRRVRQLPLTRGGKVPAIAVTALDSREARIRSRDAGFHYHLTKPVDPRKLVEIVAGLVRLTRP
jgi:CheY-like chemotaxis protein